jgi:hypothetical protein
MTTEEDSPSKKHLSTLLKEVALAQCKLGLHMAEGFLRFCTTRNKDNKGDCTLECEDTSDAGKDS